jgi:ABC-2 type transport system permease protein
MSLFRAEWRRLFGRRFTKIMLLIALALSAVVVVGFAMNTQKIDAAARARAQQQAAEVQAQNQQAAQDYYQQCLDAQAANGPAGAEKFGGDCEQVKKGYAYPVSPDQFLPPQFNLAESFERTLIILTIILTLVGFALGASYVGAEWSSGGMMNLLLWRPARPVVLGTKLATALAAMTGVWLSFTVLWTAAFWVMADTRGTLGRDTAGFWRSIALTDLRILALMLAATAMAFSLASLGRHTAMALGVGTAYGLLELGTLIFFSILGSQFPSRFRLSTYVAAWFDKGMTLYDYSTPQTCTPHGCPGPPKFVITMGGSAALIGGITLLLVGTAFYAMNRRDVT